MTTRQAAIDVLERGHASVRRLLEQVPDHRIARPGLGGGAWSPKDLIAQVCFWVVRVLAALAGWQRGDRAPIDREIYSRSIGAINADAVRARSRHTLARVLRDWDNVHGELIRTIRTMSDARWERPATPRGRKSLGHRIGQLLIGREPFAHADAHVNDLQAFVDSIPEEERSS